MRITTFLIISLFSFSITASPTSDAKASYPVQRPAQCKEEDVVYRKEWRTLSNAEKENYIDAVRCIQTKSPSLYKGVIPGAKFRADDFQVVHIQQTFVVHLNAQFLGWHRWFVWTYEQTLKKECGYKGAHPYWDWTLDATNLAASPILDGSKYSLSGNGVAKPHPATAQVINLPPAPIVSTKIPPGSGGGCVTTGPFANHIVPFGPVSNGINPTLYQNPKNLAYNPHCLVRDINQAVAGPAVTREAVATLLSQPNITAFQNVLNFGTKPGVLGLHAGGHYAVSGDMADLFSSSGDPMFFLHHAQLDRLWAIWQSRDPQHRECAIAGTGTLLNYPPSPEARWWDKIDLGKLSAGKQVPLGAVLSTRRGEFCYEYR